jgi:aminoglycoside phosphotransferase (APT) family kinase protein
LHGLIVGEIFPPAEHELGTVVTHGDVYAGNLLQAGDRVLVTDFADSRIGLRSEDLLACLKLPFTDSVAVSEFLRTYRRETGADLATLRIEEGAEREYLRRLTRRRKRGPLPAERESAIHDELQRAASILERAYSCDLF